MGTSSQFRGALASEFTARGIRLTSQRRVLLEIIEGAEQHLDAASLLRLAHTRDASINRATVYRTLELLKKMRPSPKRGTNYFELVCVDCKKIEDFESPSLDRLKQEIGRERGFRISAIRIEAEGQCMQCSQTATS